MTGKQEGTEWGTRVREWYTGLAVTRVSNDCREIELSKARAFSSPTEQLRCDRWRVTGKPSPMRLKKCCRISGNDRFGQHYGVRGAVPAAQAASF